MFRLEMIVDDKKLAYVLWALAGHVVELKPPQPIVNARKKNGAVVERTPGRMIDLFADFVKSSGDLTPAQIKEFCVKNGLSDKSYSNVLDNAMKMKLVKRIKLPGKKKFIYRPVGKEAAR